MKNNFIPAFIAMVTTFLFFSFVEYMRLIPGGNVSFSAFTLLAPLTGTSIYAAVAFLCMLGKKAMVASLAQCFYPLTYHIPTFFASAYLAYTNIVFRLIVPITCMILFVAHPVGAQAFAYSFFWLIPIVLYFIGKDSFVMHALGATFVQHAVGSVIWIYAVNMMTPERWISLIPVVIVERCAAVLLLCCGYYMLSALYTLSESLIKRYSLSKRLA